MAKETNTNFAHSSNRHDTAASLTRPFLTSLCHRCFSNTQDLRTFCRSVRAATGEGTLLRAVHRVALTKARARARFCLAAESVDRWLPQGIIVGVPIQRAPHLRSIKPTSFKWGVAVGTDRMPAVERCASSVKKARSTLQAERL